MNGPVDLDYPGVTASVLTESCIITGLLSLSFSFSLSFSLSLSLSCSVCICCRGWARTTIELYWSVRKSTRRSEKQFERERERESSNSKYTEKEKKENASWMHGKTEWSSRSSRMMRGLLADDGIHVMMHQGRCSHIHIYLLTLSNLSFACHSIDSLIGEWNFFFHSPTVHFFCSLCLHPYSYVNCTRDSILAHFVSCPCGLFPVLLHEPSGRAWS